MSEPDFPLALAGSISCDIWQKWALDNGLTPPPWFRPVTPTGNHHNHHCGPCDVRWMGPKNQPGPCWNCGLEGVEAA